jgi:hypothetical protein
MKDMQKYNTIEETMRMPDVYAGMLEWMRYDRLKKGQRTKEARGGRLPLVTRETEVDEPLSVKMACEFCDIFMISSVLHGNHLAGLTRCNILIIWYNVEFGRFYHIQRLAPVSSATIIEPPGDVLAGLTPLYATAWHVA